MSSPSHVEGLMGLGTDVTVLAQWCLDTVLWEKDPSTGEKVLWVIKIIFTGP